MSRGRNKGSYGVLFLLGLIVAGALYIYTSVMFEREVPKIVLVNDNGYWNLKKPLNITMEDVSGIKAYKIILKSKSQEIKLEEEQFIEAKKELSLEVKPPRRAFTMKESDVKIIVEARDVSKWNFFNGNSVIKEFDLVIDKKKPKLTIISNSYKIQKGGSALVIFKATDENIKDITIKTNFDKEFIAQPFYKDGYYISLLAWPVTSKNFKASVVVEDEAGNISKSNIPLYLKNKSYRISKIKISDRFLKGKIADLAEEFEETQGVEDSIEQFKIINEDVRAKNEELIHSLTSKISDEMIDSFHINKMYPLKNAKVVAHFGDHRKYSYKGKKISESYHLGLDLASNAMAAIKPQNGGEVVYSDYNGLYGNMPVIHHGLGLYTLYGHCSSVNINVGDTVEDKEHIANTGKSGYAMGDHLHFGVLVQGIEVRPQEWMDKEWMRKNISDVIKDAKEIIDRS